MPQHPGLKPGLNNSGISPWQLFQEFNWWHEKAHKTTRWEPSCPTREVNSAVMSEFSPLLPEPCLALLNTVGGWRCYISEVLVPSRLGEVQQEVGTGRADKLRHFSSSLSQLASSLAKPDLSSVIPAPPSQAYRGSGPQGGPNSQAAPVTPILVPPSPRRTNIFLSLFIPMLSLLGLFFLWSPT